IEFLLHNGDESPFTVCQIIVGRRYFWHTRSTLPVISRENGECRNSEAYKS
ncbi:unnamed protein product, partial [Heterotrigona itama]